MPGHVLSLMPSTIYAKSSNCQQSTKMLFRCFCLLLVVFVCLFVCFVCLPFYLQKANESVLDLFKLVHVDETLAYNV